MNPQSFIRRRAAVLVVSALAAVSGCSTAGPATASAPATPSAAPGSMPAAGGAGCGRRSPATPGHDFTLTVTVDPSLQAGSATRTALVHVPSGYTSGRAMPLVVEFHGAAPNATSQGYEAYSPLHRLSDSEGFIDVFPQGLRAPNGNLAWNAYGPVFWKVAEIPFVDEVLATLEATMCVDAKRVYASGLSNGGNMVNYVACRDAARFAAVAPVVGPMYGQDDGPCRPSRPVPIIDVHSFNDPAVAYNGLPGPPYNDFPLPSVPAWLAGWASLDGCSGGPVISTAGADAVRQWTGCRDGARIIAYGTEAGHAWPATLGGMPAAGVVWSFLSSYHLP